MTSELMHTAFPTPLNRHRAKYFWPSARLSEVTSARFYVFSNACIIVGRHFVNAIRRDKMLDFETMDRLEKNNF